MNKVMNKIEIYTDGSSRGNPGNGGWAFVAVYPNATGEIRIDEMGGCESNTTNNRMELMAVIEGIKFFENYYSDPLSVEYLIRLDSAYVLNGATKWIHGWRAKNWKTADRSDVKNVDLWQRLAAVMIGKKIIWKLLPGHSGIYGNERCDVIATSFADGKKPNLYSGNVAEYDGAEEIMNFDLKSSEDGVKKAKTKSKKNTAIAYSYVSKVDGVIKIDKTWVECKKRVHGAKGALYKKAVSAEDEREIIKELNSK
jgi:ribonuclease HI